MMNLFSNAPSQTYRVLLDFAEARPAALTLPTGPEPAPHSTADEPFGHGGVEGSGHPSAEAAAAAGAPITVYSGAGPESESRDDFQPPQTAEPSHLASGEGGGAPSRAARGSGEQRKVCAGAISGRLLAIATLKPGVWSWSLSRASSRMFHLGGRSQLDLRRLSREVEQFLSKESIETLSVCRTMTGGVGLGPEDEVRIESALMAMEPVVSTLDNGAVADWVITANPPAPENMPASRLTFAQIRALEAAQFVASHEF